MHTDVARGAYEITETGDGNLSEPAGTQETGVEFGGGKKPLIREVLCLSLHNTFVQSFHTRQYQTLGLCSYIQDGGRSDCLAGTRCGVLADGVGGHVAWFE